MAPVGKPELAESETELENPDPVGVTVTVYVAGCPAVTVAVGGSTLMLKSFTVTFVLADLVKLEPVTETVPLLIKVTGEVLGVVGGVGVNGTVTLAV